MRRARSVSCHERVDLTEVELLSTPAGRYAAPTDLGEAWLGALRMSMPCTIANSLAQAKQLDLAAPPDLDGLDHWAKLTLPGALAPGAQVLLLEGLATIADVWLDGQHLLRSENMFRRHELELGTAARPGAELVIRFSALSKHLATKKQRPRWRTRIVDAQQLRWVRTSLLGRTPGFCPRIPAVGPYRPIALEARRDFHVRAVEAHTSLAGQQGTLKFGLTLEAIAGASLPQTARLVISGAAVQGTFALRAEQAGEQLRFAATLPLGTVQSWWPHTHGAQPQSTLRFELDGESLELGQLAFRSLEVERGPAGKNFQLLVNGERVFCRGAVWTNDDLIGLSPAGLRTTLGQVRDAGMNMLRLGGTTTYESETFYELCDELGILVFHDFMFANMDYPVQDEGFAAECRAELRDVLIGVGERPCLAVLCGGSEVEQQVSMLGMARELWQSPLFHQLIPALAAELAPGVPYVSSSPTGGALPFQVDTGIAHYYGVGAYLRPLEDARRAELKFAAECLAFANPPENVTIERFMRDLEMPFHHPRWKERVPRDRGVGWDFEDVNDHYIKLLFGVEPRTVRYGQPERYLELSRAAVCTVMETAYAEWRRLGSDTGGALVFWLKDLWAGAGWGVIDSFGLPKAPYYALKRLFGALSLSFTDEGLNGLLLQVCNEQPTARALTLEVKLFRGGEALVSEARAALELAPREARAIPVESLFERFLDVGYAYRFGPPSHDVVVARLLEADREVGRSFHLPLGEIRAQELELGLSATFETREQQLGVRVSSQRFAQRVALEVDGYLPADSYFHLAPGDRRWIALYPRAGQAEKPRGNVSALNSLARPAIASEPSG